MSLTHDSHSAICNKGRVRWSLFVAACRHCSDGSDCPRMARTCRRRALSRSAWSDASSCADLAGYTALPARRCLGDGPRGDDIG